MTEPPFGSKDKKANFGVGPASLGALFFGVLLILVSLLPWGKAVKETLWTDVDSSKYDQASQEFHRLSYQSPERSGVTKQQLEVQIEKSRQQFEALKAKLQNATEQPLAWKRYCLWAGALLASAGVLGHLASSRE